MQVFMKKYKEICLILAITLIFMGIPVEYVHAETEGPQPISYTSSIDGTDDIRDLNKTKLDVNGSIYVKFSTPIQLNNVAPLTGQIKIYSTLKTIDSSNVNETNFEFQYTNNEFVAIGNIKNQQIQTIEKINENTIKIQPVEPFSNLTQYRLIINKEAVNNQQGNPLTSDIEVTFWTKGSTQNETPQWIVQSNGADTLQEVTGASSKTYNLINAPRFGFEGVSSEGVRKYLICGVEIDKEVIAKPSMQQFDMNSKNVYEKGLKQITLEDVYDPTRKVEFLDMELRYFVENSITKTEIKFNPVYRNPNHPGDEMKLEAGKLYRIHIPAGVFETRSGMPLEELTLNIYTEPDPSQPKSISHLENNKFKVTDLYNAEGTFSIKGINFHHNIKKLTLEPFSGKAAKSFTIQSKDFELKDSTKIDIHIRDDIRNDLKMEGNVGAYAVEITFDDTPLTVTDKVYETVINSVYATYNGSDRNDKIFLQIESKGKPTVKTKYPQSTDGKPWYDEKNLKHDVNDDMTNDKYFVKATFDDLDNQLGLTTDILDIKNCIVRPVGGLGNLVDTGFTDDISNMDNQKKNDTIQKYIFVKGTQQATLYIPVKALRAQTTYQVIIPSGMVHYKDTLQENDSFEWVFTTTSVPLVKELSTGTIPEDYDEDEPIYIEGDFFSMESSKIKVYFDDIEAEDVTVVSETQLKVYLPDGSDRLEPGTYDIIVENDINHKRTVYGSLGVVKAGDEEDIPNEEYKIKGDSKEGEVRSNLKVSEDTLFVSPSDINENVLEFDLDELMGKDTFLRKIQYDGDKKYSIGMLKTRSKWADIILYSVTLDPYAEEDEITIRLGRTEPSITQMLKRKIRGKGVASDFIQVSGENYKIKNAQLHIPLKNSNGKHIKVLRYDEGTRNFYEIPYTVNLIDQQVAFTTNKKGIFIAVKN
ncbi:IPT/TIG domain-containing protein [Crassaminicella profunda]|uniref:IPT/TIG domain-containing protein n=1 Tax=Crassaminicella profunda TaxID=1286698 RepID=UPI001CA689C4|nr:IPT/TIG domain-containing protein [Crassaminicella profunda]QZY55482.1 IPT/TIG domain-containing protein [Crassaminicella profunda]